MDLALCKCDMFSISTAALMEDAFTPVGPECVVSVRVIMLVRSPACGLTV